MKKCIITYFQNKRISLPFIFSKYCYSKMKDRFSGEMKLFHIHHDFHAANPQWESNRVLTQANLEITRQFIKEGKYPEATIITHTETFPDFYGLPSFRIGVEIAIKEKADLHLWLEDDAIVLDLDCETWYSKMLGKDVGLYRQTMHIPMVNCAFMLSSLSYDKKVFATLGSFKKDNKYYPGSSQFENLLQQHVENSVLLNRDNAIRHHPYGQYKISIADLQQWLKRKIPEIEQQDLDLLNIDFHETKNY